MPVIYEPKGKAREYSPLACNLYLACTHNCRYCYAPKALGKKPEEYFQPPYPRKDVLKKLEDELKGLEFDRQIMLSFIGDIYCDTADRGETARGALELFLEYKAPVAILTKGGSRCLKDIDLFQKFGDKIQIGATLTFWSDEKSLVWERGGARPEDRLEALKTLKESNIRTFASFEPVIEPKESLMAMKKSLDADCVDFYKIGKLNNYYDLDKNVDWPLFLKKSLELIRPFGKKIYIKHDLRLAAAGVELLPGEDDPGF